MSYQAIGIVDAIPEYNKKNQLYLNLITSGVPPILTMPKPSLSSQSFYSLQRRLNGLKPGCIYRFFVHPMYSLKWQSLYFLSYYVTDNPGDEKLEFCDTEINPGEFGISGILQRIPQNLNHPVITVYRNKKPFKCCGRLQGFLRKPNHLPIATLKGYRGNLMGKMVSLRMELTKSVFSPVELISASTAIPRYYR